MISDILILIAELSNRQFTINEDCLPIEDMQEIKYNDGSGNSISQKELLDNIEDVVVLAVKRLSDGDVFKLHDFITETDHAFSTQIGKIDLIHTPGYFIDKTSKLATKVFGAKRLYLVPKEYIKEEFIIKNINQIKIKT